ncbi:hypothetical protein BLS_002332 [Venturia inaequalis]|uniref:Meiotic expression up-regulated protein 6 PH domain-containing protein n=1 Tax=Venturia inaequalis TaxID=5025 RepID=A0A8H3URS0_VENIN|nr:hypothetical protein BLS_002332 [Venturia inaequalis]KAE9979324.1 hypothetical protein EG328_000969 [Venturia inaequalis]KAE9979593.1 hypothetical protein EG327_006994 [Venturia inaequalis]RDI80906.1 hypothetical protein Vi05172_g9093 [Venturia inaequalis]
MSDAPTTTPAVAAPVVETPAAHATETAPAVTETPAVVEHTAAATEAPVEEVAKVEAPVEAAAEEVKPVEPKYDGHLNYNAPTSFLREFLPLPPKKVFFWLGKEPIESKELTHYLAKGKEAAHSTAAWAAQTGEGLLLFSKTGEKSAPTGVLNLADAEDLKEVGTNEFSFKAGGHKHKFEAPNSAERDGWFTAVKKIAEEAKAKKEEILASESYKETLAKFSPVAAVAAIPAAKPTEDNPKKSVEAEEETQAEGLESAAKTDKSRSRSRGAPANIIGFFKGKKGDKSEEVKKEEEPVVAPATEEVAPETVAPTEPIEETVTAPVITDAVPAVEEKKDEPKPNRRMSRFESFFNKKGEKKTGEEVATPTTETAVTEPAAVEPTVETPTIAEPVAETSAPVEEETKVVTPTKERKPSFLAGIQKLTQKVRSPSSEHPPAVVAESSAVEETPAVTEPVVDAPVAAAETTEAAPATEEPQTSPTEKAEKRRSSLFDFKKFTQKPAKTAAEPVIAAEEPATSEEVKAVEEAAPVVPAAVEEPVKTSSEDKAVTEKAPKEHKESPITQLGRRFSKAIRAGVKKETKTPAKVAEDEADKVEPVSAEAPQLDKPTEAPAAIGDVVPETVHTSSAPPASNTVSATA